jgi:hypothetical protein
MDLDPSAAIPSRASDAEAIRIGYLINVYAPAEWRILHDD